MEVAPADSSAAFGAGSVHAANITTIIARYNIINKFELKSNSDAARDIVDRIVIMIR